MFINNTNLKQFTFIDTFRLIDWRMNWLVNRRSTRPSLKNWRLPLLNAQDTKCPSFYLLLLLYCKKLLKPHLKCSLFIQVSNNLREKIYVSHTCIHASNDLSIWAKNCCDLEQLSLQMTFKMS